MPNTISAMPEIEIDGVFNHFSSADEPGRSRLAANRDLQFCGRSSPRGRCRPALGHLLTVRNHHRTNRPTWCVRARRLMGFRLPPSAVRRSIPTGHVHSQCRGPRQATLDCGVSHNTLPHDDRREAGNDPDQLRRRLPRRWRSGLVRHRRPTSPDSRARLHGSDDCRNADGVSEGDEVIIVGSPDGAMSFEDIGDGCDKQPRGRHSVDGAVRASTFATANPSRLSTCSATRRFALLNQPAHSKAAGNVLPAAFR